MASKLSDLDEAFARFSMLEFVVQNMLAVQLAAISEPESSSFKADILKSFQKPRGSGVAKQLAMLERIQQLADRFLEKVSEGEAHIRAGTKPRSSRTQ